MTKTAGDELEREIMWALWTHYSELRGLIEQLIDQEFLGDIREAPEDQGFWTVSRVLWKAEIAGGLNLLSDDFRTVLVRVLKDQQWASYIVDSLATRRHLDQGDRSETFQRLVSLAAQQDDMMFRLISASGKGKGGDAIFDWGDAAAVLAGDREDSDETMYQETAVAMVALADDVEHTIDGLSDDSLRGAAQRYFAEMLATADEFSRIGASERDNADSGLLAS